MFNMDKEYIINYFQDVIYVCDRTTTGNISHQMSSIIGISTHIADKVKEQYGENITYNNLMHIIELASKTITSNVAHKVATIKGLCRRNIDFINEFGLDQSWEKK